MEGMKKLEKEKLDPNVVDRLLSMLREGKPRYEIMKELGIPYHTRKIIPPERIADYHRACMVGRAKRYRRRLMIRPMIVKCPECGASIVVRGGENG